MFKTILLVTLFGICLGAGNHPKCGLNGPNMTLSGRIIGGRSAKRGTWPWMGSLMLQQEKRGRPSPFFDHWCGCFLLSEQWAMTSAHCLDSTESLNKYKLVFGMYNRRALLNDPPGQKVKEDDTIQMSNVSKIIIHPKYNNPKLANDLALLKLSKPVDLSNRFIGTVCLPDKQKLDDVVARSPCMAIGWGKASYQGRYLMDELEQVKVPVHKQANCTKAYKGAEVKIDNGMVCVGQQEAGVCNGDSGGPLNCKVGNKWYSYGAASFGKTGCHKDDTPSVYTRTSEYSKWVWDMISSQN